ncbi:MAG: MoaD/ThiS family protein [Thermomicrobiales bacterium]|nr:MoaD/ThiS family protein [Thermomicrobiales bacterium]
MIRVIIPSQLGSLSDAPKEAVIQVDGTVTPNAILDALEVTYPRLKGLLRDNQTRQRRPMIRYFVAEEDISHADPDAELPAEVASGKEPFWIVAAISGG